uniref:Uncharacterized protein n=1 Tax=Paramoeba aestuarina TaxID=180227 RepID=A0A7S4P8R2_9EUKA
MAFFCSCLLRRNWNSPQLLWSCRTQTTLSSCSGISLATFPFISQRNSLHFYSTLPGEEGRFPPKNERSFEDRMEEEMDRVAQHKPSDLFATFTPDEKEYELQEESAPKKFLEGVGQLFTKKPMTHQQKVDEIRRTEWLIRMAKFEMMERMKEQKEEIDQKDPIILKYSTECEQKIVEEIRKIEELALHGPDPTSPENKTKIDREVYAASVRITDEYYEKMRKEHPDVIPKPIRQLKMIESAKQILNDTLGKDYVPGRGEKKEVEGGESVGELSEESLRNVKKGISLFR